LPYGAQGQVAVQAGAHHLVLDRRLQDHLGVVTHHVARVITPPEGYGSRARLQIDPPAARGACVDGQRGVGSPKRIPQAVEPLDVPHLRHAAAIGLLGVRMPPVVKGIDVVVDAEPSQVVFTDGRVQVRSDVLPRLRVAQVEQAAAIAGERDDPLGVLRGDAGTRRHSFGLEPQQEVHARVPHGVADVREPPREAVGWLNGGQRQAVVAHCARESPGTRPVRVKPEDLEPQPIERPEV